MFTRRFWTLLAERAIGAFAATAVGLLGADGLGITAVHWGAVVSVAGLAALLTVLKGLVATQVGDPESPSLLDR